MRSPFLPAALAVTALFAARPALAHVVAGNRTFPVTLTFDDPGVSDEVSIPAIGYSRSAADDAGPGHEVDLGFEFDKTITPTTAIILNDGYDIQQHNQGKTQTGWENLTITGKWQAYTNADHEFVASLGVTREIGGTGTLHTGADEYGSTTPTAYFGKGLGDLPIGYLRPLAITGEFSYTVADKALKQFQGQSGAGANAGSPFDTGIAAQFNNGNNNSAFAGISIQYSLPYLQSQVRDIGLPDFIGKLIPIVEFTWSSPTNAPSTQGTTWSAAPGVIYLANWGEIGVEATVPLNKAAGTNVGAVGLVHFFLDDLFPTSIGKPIFN